VHPRPWSVDWPEFVQTDWLKAAQYRRDLQWSGKLPQHPAVILEEQERLMQLAWERQHPSRDLILCAKLDRERVSAQLRKAGLNPTETNMKCAMKTNSWKSLKMTSRTTPQRRKKKT